MTDLERCLAELSRTMSRAALVLAVMEARKRKAEVEKLEDR